MGAEVPRWHTKTRANIKLPKNNERDADDGDLIIQDTIAKPALRIGNQRNKIYFIWSQ